MLIIIFCSLCKGNEMTDVQIPIVAKAIKIQERREAILKLLSTNKEEAMNKEAIYKKLEDKYPHFAAQKYDHVQNDASKTERYKYRTLVRDLEYLCLIGKVAFFKDGGGIRNADGSKSAGMYKNEFLTQISNEEWREYSKNIVLATDEKEFKAEGNSSKKNNGFVVNNRRSRKDSIELDVKVEGRHKKNAEIDLKNKLFEILNRSDKKREKSPSRYRAAWRGGWRYFLLEEEVCIDEDANQESDVQISADFAEEAAFYGQFSGEHFHFLKTLQGKLPTEILHGRVLATTESHYQPKESLLHGMQVISQAILNKKKVTFYLPPLPGHYKNTKVTAHPLGIINKRGIYIFVGYQIVGSGWKCTQFHLSEMRDVTESDMHHSDELGENEIRTMLSESLSYSWLTESVEKVSLFLHKSAAYKFKQFASIVQHDIEFSWVDRTNEVAKVSFEARINEQLVEDLVSMGGNVIVEGSEELKRYVKQYQMPSNGFEEILQQHLAAQQ
jgi:hypothetical protein